MLRDNGTRGRLRSSEGSVKTNGSSTFLRRFTGPEAHELFALVRPERGTTEVARQAEAVYRALSAVLVAEGASLETLASETLFIRDIRKDLAAVLDAREQAFGKAGLDARGPLTSFIEQPPLTEEAPFELSIFAVIPRRRPTYSAGEVRGTPRCGCKDCARTCARLVRLADHTCFYTGSIHGSGGTAFDEAYDMFRCADDLLQQAGMSFRDVLRTWIYLRDIDRDYPALNRARREFFRHRGVELRPASTGIGGGLVPGKHHLSMRLYAACSPRPLDVESLSAPSLGEAWLYGADFSRGLKVVEANKVALYVSGTASVDEAGRTVHVGKFEPQADRMLANISSLLGARGASFRHVLSAVTYLKRPHDAALLRSMFHVHGFEGFPTAIVEAPLCRPELLCETEVVAALPLPQPEA
jgi:enamine deaminase RidA (YjgF/YER057c/UK114 family)